MMPLFPYPAGSLALLCCLMTAPGVNAAILHVPAEFATIQAAIGMAQAGDTVAVAPGTYRGRLKLKPGIIVRSEGGGEKGALGMRRAEAVILDGTDGPEQEPGVAMAAGAVLDGFTITGVGPYDAVLWQQQYDAHGDGQEHGETGQAGTPGIAVNDDCAVLNNIVHHIGSTGITITGAAGRKVSPRIAGNVCYRNMGGGIGSMDGSTAVIENNLCFENYHAGIGHRRASPLVQRNLCHHNIRAGIGISDGASPVVKDNRCFQNRRAGIGIRTGKDTRPVVEGNECSENDRAGIGVEEGARPFIRKNRLTGNRLVAIGVTGGSAATIERNDLSRQGGAPPLIAVLEDSSAVISGNTLRGGGVAGILVKGHAEIRDNQFIGSAPEKKPPSGNAVWGHPGSEVIFTGNRIEYWPSALLATGAAEVVANDNRVSSFGRIAIVIKDCRQPAEATGNTVLSSNPGALPVQITGPSGKVSGNQLVEPATDP